MQYGQRQLFLSIHMIGNVISRTASQVSNRQIEGFRKSVCSIRNYTPEQLVRLNVSSFFHSEKILYHILHFLYGATMAEKRQKRCLYQFSPPRTGQHRSGTDFLIFHMYPLRYLGNHFTLPQKYVK